MRPTTRSPVTRRGSPPHRRTRELRFLAHAYLAAKDFDAAEGVIDTGLALAPDDVALIEDRGEVKAREGDAEGAHADWRHAHEPGHEISARSIPAPSCSNARGGWRRPPRRGPTS